MPKIVLEMDDCLLTLTGCHGDEWLLELVDTGWQDSRRFEIDRTGQQETIAVNCNSLQAGAILALATGMGEADILQTYRTFLRVEIDQTVNTLYKLAEEICATLPRNLRPIP